MASSHFSASFLVLASSLAAQGLVVSPVGFTTTDGQASAAVPFTNSWIRYQQAHGDMRGDAKLFTALALRRDGFTTVTSGIPRTLELELVFAHTKFLAVTNEFAANYEGEPTLVISRKAVAAPDWTVAPLYPPAPFDFTLTFDSPVAYSGTTDLLWDLKIYASNAVGFDYPADYAMPAPMDALALSLGNGCISTHQSSPYEVLGTITALSSGEYCFGARGLYAPIASPFNYLLFGNADPNIDIPGLCTTLHSNTMVVLTMPVADGVGSWAQPCLFFPANPYWVGFDLYWQALSVDYGQPGLPYSMSSGRKLTLAGIPYGPKVLVKNLYELDVNAVAASTIGAGGLVTQFQF